MTAIPEDIMRNASDAHADFARSSVKDNLTVIIARALASERRRCALIARQWQESSFKDETFAANSIADKIMAGGK